MSAVAHAHLDTAWLWPIDETRRKAQRTFSTAVGLMDRYEDFKFAVSQAYQYAVIETVDPDLFARIKAKVAAGQWLPVGGSWVEPDCNLPTGESLCRQFLYGQSYFQRAFGVRSTIFWNPDVFGYDGQLPQLMRQAGMSRFLTQKLSWNRFTAPPHHSFRWRGIDGSEVLTHFPPADTYNGECQVEELRYHGANYKDADRTPEALYLFGFGDGGGGAHAEMIEALRRAADLQGLPRTQIRTPEAFFDRLAASADDLAVIQGELYFEYHRGVYTSQSETKRLNRLCETRLQALEFLATAARLSFGVVALLGTLAIVSLGLRFQDRALSLMPTWLLLLVWMFGAWPSSRLTNSESRPTYHETSLLVTCPPGRNRSSCHPNAYAAAIRSPCGWARMLATFQAGL